MVKRNRYTDSIIIGFGIVFLYSTFIYAQTEQWVYRYNGPGNGNDQANSIIYGLDDNIYVAGYSTGIGTGEDFTVISLDSTLGIEEYFPKPNLASNFELLSTFFNEKISIRFANFSNLPLKVALYNILGARVYETSFPATPSFLCLNDETISRLPKGIYFLSISQDKKAHLTSKKIIKP